MTSVLLSLPETLRLRQARSVIFRRHAMLRQWLTLGALAASLTMPSVSQAPDSATRRQLVLALDAAEHGALERALSIDGEILREHPRLLPALKLRGAVLEKLGRTDEAISTYVSALAESSNDADLLMKLGFASLRREDYPHAIEYLHHYAQLRPSDANALFYLAQAYHLHGLSDQALATIRRCVRIVPGNAQFLQKYGELLIAAGNAHDAIACLRKAWRLDSTLDKLDFDFARAFYYELDFAQAAQHAERAVTAQPEDPNSLNVLASSQERLHDWQACSSSYKRLLALKPDFPSAYLGLGHCQLELGQAKDSIDSIQHALHEDPAIPQAHFFLSRALAMLGDAEEARHESELHQKMQQMSFSPMAPDTETGNMAWKEAASLVMAGRENEAVRRLEYSLPSTSRHVSDVMVLAGALCLSLGKVDEGERLLHAALAAQPSVRGAHTYLGLAALARDAIPEAEREFQAELAADPNYLPALEGLGEVRYLQQRWLQAVTLLTASRTTNPAALYRLTDAYFRLGRTQDARLAAEVSAARVQAYSEIARSFAVLLDQNGESVLAARLFPSNSAPVP